MTSLAIVDTPERFCHLNISSREKKEAALALKNEETATIAMINIKTSRCYKCCESGNLSEVTQYVIRAKFKPASRTSPATLNFPILLVRISLPLAWVINLAEPPLALLYDTSTCRKDFIPHILLLFSHPFPSTLLQPHSNGLSIQNYFYILFLSL